MWTNLIRTRVEIFLFSNRWIYWQITLKNQDEIISRFIPLEWHHMISTHWTGAASNCMIFRMEAVRCRRGTSRIFMISSRGTLKLKESTVLRVHSMKLIGYRLLMIPMSIDNRTIHHHSTRASTSRKLICPMAQIIAIISILMNFMTINFRLDLLEIMSRWNSHCTYQNPDSQSKPVNLMQICRK